MKYAMAIFMLLILLMACQPAISPVAPTPAAIPVPSPVTPPASLAFLPTPVPPKFVEKVTTFDSVKYTNPTYQFSVAYPDELTPAPTTLKGGVFYATVPGGDLIHIAVRPATNFRDAAITYVNDLIASTGTSFSPNIDSETTITLADGTKADLILLSAAFGQVKIAVTGVLKDGNAIMICGARNPKNLELFKEIGSTLVVQTAIVNSSTAQPGDNITTQAVPTATDQTTSLKVLFDRQGIMYSTNIDGSGEKRISMSSDMSPDGKTRVIAAQTDFNYRALYLANADGTNKRPIIPIGGGLPDHAFPVWSPDGSKIAFCKSQPYMGSSGWLCYNIWIMNPDGSEIRKISNTMPAGQPRSHTCPQWFPDSKKLAYGSNESGWWEIYTSPIDNNESSLIVRLQQTFKLGWFPWDYKVSQDGKRLIYRDGPGTDLKTLVIDIGSKKITEWPNIDTSEISPVKSQDGIVTVITRADGLYYTDNIHKEPFKIPSTAAGDIAMGFAE